MLTAARTCVLGAVTLAACGTSQTTGPTAPATTTPTRAVMAVPTATTAPAFSFSSRSLSSTVRSRVRGSSWRPGCPVGLGELRYLRIGYWGFDGRRHRGEMIVNASAVSAVRRTFAELFRKHFPIRRMRLVDDYGASDYRSIEADNTSAFNCRRATGQTRWSQHAYGRAVDVNTIENPYVYADGTSTHAASRPYLDRSRHHKGMAYAGGVLVTAFTRTGWGWGGTWPRPTDYQHFSANGT